MPEERSTPEGHPLPWSHEELQALLRSTGERLAETEAIHPNIRPVPPLTEAEAQELLTNLLDLAATRILTEDETFLGGQLLAQYRHAICASMLGKKGRYYVVSEEDIALAKAGGEKARTPPPLDCQGLTPGAHVGKLSNRPAKAQDPLLIFREPLRRPKGETDAG